MCGSGAQEYKKREGDKANKPWCIELTTGEDATVHFTEPSEIVSRTFRRGFHPNPGEGLHSRPLPGCPLGKLNWVW